MGSHSKVFQPVDYSLQTSYITVSDFADLRDNDTSTYAGFKTNAVNESGVYLYYNFSALPANSVLASVIVGNTQSRWYKSTTTREFLFIKRITNRISGSAVYDKYTYTATDARLSYRSSAVVNTKYSFTNYPDLLELADNSAFSIDDLRATRQIINTETGELVEAGYVYIAVGFYCGTSASTSHYLNFLPITVTYSLPDYTCTFKAGTGGTVSTPSATVDAETSATCTATASTGYKFSKWTGSDGSSYTTSTITVCPSANVTYTATFTANTATITVNSADTTMGTVTGGGSYSIGSTATLTATAKDGYKFTKWNDGNTSATRTITVTGSATYTAYFAAEIPSITNVSVAPNPANAEQGYIITVTVS